MDNQKALERIELQLKAIWWDNLLYVFGMISVSLVIIALLTKIPILCVVGCMLFIIMFIVIQIAEDYEKNKIREEYKK